MPSQPDGSHRGFAFVQFNSTADVETALEEKQVCTALALFVLWFWFFYRFFIHTDATTLMTTATTTATSTTTISKTRLGLKCSAWKSFVLVSFP